MEEEPKKRLHSSKSRWVIRGGQDVHFCMGKCVCLHVGFIEWFYP